MLRPMTGDCEPGDAVVVLTTCGTGSDAAALARKLVAGRLAACVNIVPGIESVYRWQGDIEAGREVLLIIKTSQGRFEDLAAAIRAESGYELPEVLAVPVAGGSAEYLRWISTSTEIT